MGVMYEGFCWPPVEGASVTLGVGGTVGELGSDPGGGLGVLGS